MVRAFVAVGSNIDPALNVQRCLLLLAGRVALVNVSTVYETRAEGHPEQADFYNCVVEIDTDQAARDLKFNVLRFIESSLKRERSADKYAPRTIDLDLILYGDLVLKTSDVVLPDPDILRRFFIAAPLAELAPGLILPGSDIRIRDIAARLPREDTRPLESYTARLRQILKLGS